MTQADYLTWSAARNVEESAYQTTVTAARWLRAPNIATAESTAATAAATADHTRSVARAVARQTYVDNMLDDAQVYADDVAVGDRDYDVALATARHDLMDTYDWGAYHGGLGGSGGLGGGLGGLGVGPWSLYGWDAYRWDAVDWDAYAWYSFYWDGNDWDAYQADVDAALTAQENWLEAVEDTYESAEAGELAIRLASEAQADRDQRVAAAGAQATLAGTRATQERLYRETEATAYAVDVAAKGALDRGYWITEANRMAAELTAMASATGTPWAISDAAHRRSQPSAICLVFTGRTAARFHAGSPGPRDTPALGRLHAVHSRGPATTGRDRRWL